jgi:hypothetical protein
MTATNEHVLAVHPTTQGFGWILFEGPDSPLTWGIVCAAPKRQTHLVNRFERILKRSNPRTLVIEDCDAEGTRRGPRAQALCKSMLHLARCADMRTSIYPWSMVRACFAAKGAQTRHEIARAVADQIEVLWPRLPSERKLWLPPSRNQALFDAAALAITHYTAREFLG